MTATTAPIPADAYYSIVGSITANPFVEFRVRVKDLKYNKGLTESVALDYRLSYLDPEEATTPLEVPVKVDPQPW